MLFPAYQVTTTTIDGKFISRQLIYSDATGPDGLTLLERYGVGGTVAPETTGRKELRSVLPLMDGTVGVEALSLLAEVIDKCVFMSNDLQERCEKFVEENNFEKEGLQPID